MQFFGGRNSSFDCIFFCVEQTKVIIFAVRFYIRSPFPCWPMQTNTFVARGVRFVNSYVSHVFSFTCQTKVAPSVIRRIFVNVINLVGRPFSCLHGPYNSVGAVLFASNPNSNSTFFAVSHAPGNVARFAPTSGCNFPYKLPGFWVILKKSVEFLRRDHSQYLPRSLNFARGNYGVA